jgi:hypothetical protein
MTVRSTDIEAVWQNTVWEHPDIVAITPNAYQYDVSVQSELDFNLLCHEAEVNFFLAKTLRRAEPILTQQTRYTFQVEVSYYLQQADIAQNTYRTVRDRLETLDDLVHTALGKSWGSTVDFWQGGIPTAIREIEISERICWTGAITYTAFKTT